MCRRQRELKITRETFGNCKAGGEKRGEGMRFRGEMMCRAQTEVWGVGERFREGKKRRFREGEKRRCGEEKSHLLLFPFGFQMLFPNPCLGSREMGSWGIQGAGRMQRPGYPGVNSPHQLGSIINCSHSPPNSFALSFPDVCPGKSEKKN